MRWRLGLPHVTARACYWLQNASQKASTLFADLQDWFTTPLWHLLILALIFPIVLGILLALLVASAVLFWLACAAALIAIIVSYPYDPDTMMFDA